MGKRLNILVLDIFFWGAPSKGMLSHLLFLTVSVVNRRLLIKQLLQLYKGCYYQQHIVQKNYV